MKETDELLLRVAVIGGLIGFGKLLAGHEAISTRKVIGRTILGSASSMVAFSVLIKHPNLSSLALVGLSSLLGILGHTTIEYIAIKYLNKKKDDNDDLK